MQQQPLSPAPDVDQALLVRMAMDMDWPPAPATDAFLEMAIERLLDEPDPAPPPRTADAPFVSARPLPPRRAHRPNAAPVNSTTHRRCPACGRGFRGARPYRPTAGSLVERILALLRERGAMSTGEIWAAVGKRKGGVQPYLLDSMRAGMVRALPDPRHPRWRLYELVDQ